MWEKSCSFQLNRAPDRLHAAVADQIIARSIGYADWWRYAPVQMYYALTSDMF